MKAAVVNTFGVAPIYEDFAEPEPGADETIVSVDARALSPIVRLLASGRHHTSGMQAGFVPGVDGIGHDGKLPPDFSTAQTKAQEECKILN